MRIGADGGDGCAGISFAEAEIADSAASMKIAPTLLRLGPGWLFVLAGLALCSAGILIPAQSDLGAINDQLRSLREAEAIASSRLQAHQEFLVDLERHDPALIRRLAAGQLNLVPEGETPLLVTPSVHAPVTDWIDATVRVDRDEPPTQRESILSRLSRGPERVWLLAAGALSLFVGLLIDPSLTKK